MMCHFDICSPKVAALAAVVTMSLAFQTSAQVTISDSDFAESDWDHWILWSRPSATLGPMRREASGGHESAYQRGEHITDGPWATIYDGHLYLADTYDPGSQGAVESIDIEYDYIDFREGGTQNGVLIVQDGRAFVRAVDSSYHSSWTRHERLSLPVDDPNWQEATVDGMVYTAPDFSSSGTPIQVGYYTFNWSLSQGFLIHREWGIDDFLIRFNQACRADFNGDGTVNTLDFLAFLNAYNAADPRADFNGDGAINTLDFLEFLNTYSAGCE